MDALAGIPIAGLTAPALLGIAILMLLNGKLWTNNAYQAKSQECDYWKGAYEKEREARGAADAQAHELLEVSKTTHHIVLALFQNAQERNRGGLDVPPSA